MELVILGVPLLALVGFLFASYSIVANDVIQTLGTFLSSNAKRPWMLLWACWPATRSRSPMCLAAIKE